MPRSPKFAGFISISHITPLGTDWALRTSAIARFTTGYDFTAGAGGPLHNDRQNGFTKVDGSLTLIAPTNTELSLYGRNIFGVHYIEYAQTASFGAFQVRPMPPTYGIRISQRF